MHFLTGRYFKVSEDKAKFEYLRAKQGPFISSGYSFTVEQSKTPCLFQLPCWIRDLHQLSALLNLGQQDTKPKWQILLWQTLSSSIYPTWLASFHQSHVFCYQQQQYHSSNESLVLVVGQWWAKLQCLYNLLLSQYCRDDPWVPLISMAFMKVT